MGKPAAVLTDQVMGTCLHTYQSTSPSPAGPVPTPVPMNLPFVGKILGPGAPTVMICGKPATVMGSQTTPTCGLAPGGGPAKVVSSAMTVLIG